MFTAKLWFDTWKTPALIKPLNNSTFKFENLLVWQKAINYVELIYKISKDFPRSEIFALQSQLRRAAVSVALNIAEGSGRKTKKDFAKFVYDANGSLRETVTALHIAKRLNYIEIEEFNKAYQQATEISKMLYRLARSLSSG